MRRISSWPVCVTVEGMNAERFLRHAGEQGVCLTRLRRKGPRRLMALAAERDIPVLQEIALSGGWRLSIGERHGAGRMLDWLSRRWLLFGGLVMAMLAVAAASQVIWQIEIVDAGAYAADIRKALADMNIASPMLRRQVDVGALRDSLEWRYPRIAWFECGLRGTTLIIRPEMGVFPRDEADPGPCDIVADRDGIIHTIITRAGTPVVAAGDIVREGEVLVRGEERTSDGQVRAVAARGSVIARVWEGASIRMSAVEHVTTYTGRTETVWTIRTPWFDLWRLPASTFAAFDAAVSETKVCGMFIPAVLHVEERRECTISAHPREPSALEAEAQAAARRKLTEKLGEDESLIDIWGNCSMIDDENLLSVAIGEIRVEIGRQKRSDGMAAPGN